MARGSLSLATPVCRRALGVGVGLVRVLLDRDRGKLGCLLPGSTVLDVAGVAGRQGAAGGPKTGMAGLNEKGVSHDTGATLCAMVEP